MYDPNNPTSINNVLSDCDKWLLEPWSAYEFHLPAITYKSNIMSAAEAELKRRWIDARDKWQQEWIAYLNAQHSKGSNQTHKNYPSASTGTPPSPSVSISLDTVGIQNSGYYPKTPTLGASLNITFAPAAKKGNGGTGQNADGTCRLIPWEVCYQGNPQWVWYEGSQYNQWSGTVQGTNYVTGGDASQVQLPCAATSTNPNNRWYFYYAPDANTEMYPNNYAIRPLAACWDYIWAVCQTLKVEDAARIWYIPDAINPVPLDPVRILPPPATFPAQVRIEECYMRMAIGYIPSTGVKDCIASYQGGIKLDITKFCEYIPDPTSTLGGGRIKINAFNYRDALHNSLLRDGNVTADFHPSEGGTHTLEVIDMGIEAYLTIYDDKGRATAKVCHKAPKTFYYVPSLDNGEYIYRKQWQVFNPSSTSTPSIIQLYRKDYGKLGIKKVFDLFNHFDVSMTFCIQTSLHTGSYLAISDINRNIIVKVAPNSHRRVTAYVYAEDESRVTNDTFFGTQWISLSIDVDFAKISDTEMYRRRDLSYIDAKLPTASRFAANNYVYGPDYVAESVNVIELTALSDDSLTVHNPPINENLSTLSGQYCTSITLSKQVRTTPPTYEFYRTSDGLYRDFDTATRVYFNAHRYKAWISPDIDVVYHNTIRENRFSQFSYFLTTPYVRYIGGAAATFCSSTDKTVTFSPAMESITLTHYQANTPSYYVGHGMIDAGIPYNTDYNINYYPWRLSDVVPSLLTPPTVECFFVGKVVDGWDNNPIEVNVPDMNYSAAGVR
jgi:hypothetical protein